MPYQNDMSTLADVVSPAYAAQQAGMQNELENTRQSLANQLSQGQLAAKIQEPTLANALLKAQGQAEQGVAGQQQALGLTALGNQPLAQQAQAQGLKTQITGDQAKNLGMVGSMAGQIAGMMDNLPPPARPAAMQQVMQQYNLNPDQIGPLASGDPEQLRNFSKNAIQMSQDYQTRSMEATTKGEYGLAEAELAGKYHLASTQELAGARKYAADAAAEVKKATAPLGALQQQIYTRLTNGSSKDPAGDRAMLNNINQTLQQIHQTSLFQQGITGTNAPATVPPVPGTTQGTPSITAPTQQPTTAATGNAVEEEMRRRGLLK